MEILNSSNDLKIEAGPIKITYEVLFPGGNTTALVEKIIENYDDRKRINNQIMKVDRNVEQVGFFDLTYINKPRLQMAGNELCVNAIRALAYLSFLKSGGKVREFEIEVILNNKSVFLKAGVDGLRNSWMEIPTSNINITRFTNESIVSLEGITQVVEGDLIDETEEVEVIKSRAIEILNKFNLLNSVPAAGVTFISTIKTGLKIIPVVWVRDVQTLFLETACGSATIATYVALTNQQVKCDVQQPSGFALQVETRLNSGDNQTTVLRISGPVKRTKSNVNENY